MMTGRGDAERAPLTPTVFHVLLALSDGPLHGYGIMKRTEAESGVSTGPGTVYGALGRLVDAGWVRQGEVPEGSDARRSSLFELTGEGRQAFAAEARRITRLSRMAGVRAALQEDTP